MKSSIYFALVLMIAAFSGSLLAGCGKAEATTAPVVSAVAPTKKGVDPGAGGPAKAGPMAVMLGPGAKDADKHIGSKLK
jgi:hypothetical protein